MFNSDSVALIHVYWNFQSTPTHVEYHYNMLVVEMSYQLSDPVTMTPWSFIFKFFNVVTTCFSATGVLKGYDALLNVVLDNTTEYLRGGWCLLFCAHIYGTSSPEILV